MSKILSLLFKAKERMPCMIPNRISADMLLTLLFWKLLSDWWLTGAKRYYRHYTGHDPVIIAMMQRNQIVLNEGCLYQTCQWQNPFEAGLSIRRSLNLFADAQPNRALHGILRAERFGPMSEFATMFSGNRIWADVFMLIGDISIMDAAPMPSMGYVFSQAVAILELWPDAIPANMARLLVQLVDPQANESVCDPACGGGQLLLAAVAEVEKHTPDNQLLVYGQEFTSNQWALTKMQLLIKGLHCHQLEMGDALDKPLLFQERLQLVQTDMVLTAVPFQPWEWDFANARHENFKRFPVAPPSDSRLALIWHGLASMKPGGRGAFWLPLEILGLEEAEPLRRYLVERGLLEAVIHVPHRSRRLPEGEAVILLVGPHQIDGRVAFISGKPTLAKRIPYSADDILPALAVYRVQRSAPCLNVVACAGMAQHQFSFDVMTYEAGFNSDGRQE